eukprot:703342-Rhodomonas_salina.1
MPCCNKLSSSVNSGLPSTRRKTSRICARAAFIVCAFSPSSPRSWARATCRKYARGGSFLASIGHTVTTAAGA